VNLLVLASKDQLLNIENIIYLSYKTSYLNEEVNCIVSSPLVSVPCLLSRAVRHTIISLDNRAIKKCLTMKLFYHCYNYALLHTRSRFFSSKIRPFLLWKNPFLQVCFIEMLRWHHDIQYNDTQPNDNQHTNKEFDA